MVNQHTSGPLGFPMSDKAARALDALLKSLPKTKDYEYRKSLVARAPTELNPGERSDVSWISTESVDRAGEVVIARGMNDAQFQQNPLVTLGHAYDGADCLLGLLEVRDDAALDPGRGAVAEADDLDHVGAGLERLALGSGAQPRNDAADFGRANVQH